MCPLVGFLIWNASKHLLGGPARQDSLLRPLAGTLQLLPLLTNVGYW